MAGGLLLAIDTAGERCSAAVLRLADGAILAAVDPVVGRGHAEVLMDTVAEALETAGAGWGEIVRLGVGIGPGSFTGIRVAVAAARGFELSLGVASVGVTTLEAQAEPFWAEAPVLAVHDARRGEVYAALFDRGGAPLSEPEALVPGALAALARRASAPVRLVGSGSGIAAEALGLDAARIDDTEGSAPIRSLARIAARRAVAAPPLPLYLRGADAKAQAPSGLRAAPWTGTVNP
ncbi:tRNA (adenosine(37)-N6)-threonylcarbamoyltransferase complex dimerization subunit type 1 TsaB [Aureimonas flava]|uniref:tRNA (Adenosine(37)-N6)-threonylcarbamoyltransferase complex dimerization subunit type 1 TsaB n=1 Tax=Aureimonas flava TaxID=2320271 RepID=A0A3A1WKE3_9HYPH|nr:tRNA (adenosine(37)-N6)-threonylcarbamoyltransferase complex dimerization subunit type 1 TsaB [Aureimonas flava]RIY00782.1 tRNA (adenosine(37)-N6)-threonylcarbamoyltransferase complex dimerization subunit type 1 TsaB [Aureimonas flava]